jgi:hypothetical protein
MNRRKRKKQTASHKRRESNKKSLSARKKARAKKPARRKRRARPGQQTIYDISPIRQDIRAYTAGQSGDMQGISDVERADSESVAELSEEGQDFEAEVVSGVENAPDADQGEVRTHEVPADDVPPEYLERE